MSLRARTPIVIALCVLGFTIAVAPATSGTSRARVRMGPLESAVLSRLNAVRAQYGLRALRASQPLTNAATQHSVEMGTDGYFDHNSFDGTAFWKRISRFYPEIGSGYWSVGENLLWSQATLDANQAVALWMNSPPHRANILSTAWREIGLASAHFSSPGGVYDGQPATILTADFGVRR